MALSAARQVSEDRCQDPLRSRNLETGKAGLGPEWARGAVPARPQRPPLLPPPLCYDGLNFTSTGPSSFYPDLLLKGVNAVTLERTSCSRPLLSLSGYRSGC